MADTTLRPRVGIVGLGRVGTALVLTLAAKGWHVAAVSSRTDARARQVAERITGCRATSAQGVADVADLILLAVPDDTIRAVAESVQWQPDQSAVHTSGAQDRSALRAAAEAGAATGVLHPLQTFPPPGETVDLRGAIVSVEAEPPLERHLDDVARSLGGEPFRLPEGARPLYHASAHLASAGLTTLLGECVALWQSFGADEPTALRALRPLVQATLDAANERGVVSALTGPVARGDVGTVERHVAAIEERRPELLPLYRHLFTRTTALAVAGGVLASERAEAFQRLLAAPAEETACE